MSRRRNIYVRHWRIIQALHGRRYGLPITALLDEVGTTRSTFYRDLGVLREVGVPIASELRNGEARYYLLDARVPPLQPTPLEVHALRLARTLLAPLEGSRILGHLDDLLARVPGHRPAASISAKRPAPSDPSIVATLERAMQSGRRLRIRYRGARDEGPRWRRVDPIGIRLSGDHVYLVAHDHDAGALRTFKVSRIARAEVLAERASRHDDVDLDRLFEHSVKVWSGEPVEVAVHIAEPVARHVNEWPLLPSQKVTDVPGGVIVRAEVAGIEETVRWVLGWGRAARPLSPDSLVEAVRAELEGALRGLRRSRPTHGGTRWVQAVGGGQLTGEPGGQ